jgi:CRISPR-associated exonuclease Cas4
MSTESQLLPLSALQHLLYCERQCALIHLEQVWAENRFTAEGQRLHHKTNTAPDESRPGIRITRSLPVASEILGLYGLCDVVEFHRDGTVLPVEYKRGRPKAHRADEVQVCAQAMALEEMLDLIIPAARLFYGKNRRRSDILLDAGLRQLTAGLAARLHDLIASRRTPPATYAARKCDACSLIDLCRPRAAERSAACWLTSQLKSHL